MPQYYRLNVNEREEIALGLAQGRSQRDIAASLGRSPSTICHEISRNTNCEQLYRAVKAQCHTNKLTHTARKKRKLDIHKPLKQFVFKLSPTREMPHHKDKLTVSV